MSIKVTVNSTPVTVKEITFPCLRKGQQSGNLYLFSSMTAKGIPLQDAAFEYKNVGFVNTTPFIGSITLEST